MKLAAIVVLYYPDWDKLLCNLESYANQVEKLYIFDNSYDLGKPHFIDIKQLSNKIKIPFNIITLNDNVGMGKALNVGVIKCIEGGYSHLLTMDQDSSFRDKDFENFIKEFEINEHSKLAIFATLHNNYPNKNNLIGSGKKIVMTSGNIININIAHKVGMFQEGFFIDHIDHYYCLKVQTLSYEIQFSSIKLKHNLGEKGNRYGLRYIRHSPIRFYYFVRNGLYTKYQFPEFGRFLYLKIFTEFIKLSLFDFKIKEAFYYLIKGVKDFKMNKDGKLIK